MICSSSASTSTRSRLTATPRRKEVASGECITSLQVIVQYCIICMMQGIRYCLSINPPCSVSKIVLLSKSDERDPGIALHCNCTTTPHEKLLSYHIIKLAYLPTDY